MDTSEAYVSCSIALMMRISRWLGVAPLNIVKYKNGWRVGMSHMRAKCAIFIVFILNIIAIYAVTNDLIWKLNKKGGQSKERCIVWFFNLTMIFSTVDVGTYRARKRMISTITNLNMLRKINLELELTTFKWFHTNETLKSILYVAWMLLFTIIALVDGFVILFQITTTVEAESNFGIIFLSYILFYLSNLICSTLEMQFVMIAMFIVSSFKALNENLIQLVQDCEPSPLTSHETVRKLWVAYSSICNVQRKVDRCYGPVVLLLIISSLLQLLVTSYFWISNFYESSKYPSKIPTLSTWLWCSIHSFNLFIIIEPGYYTQTEVETTKELVSVLMRCTDTRKASSPLYIELNLFYQQLMLNNVVYLPMGVTTLTRPVAAGIFGSIITYLIVLVQVHMQNTAHN